MSENAPAPGRIAVWRRRASLAFTLFTLAAAAVYLRRGFPFRDLPPVAGRTLVGDAVRIPDGRPLVVHVWATWCGVCKFEEPNVKAFAKDARVVSVAAFSGEGFEVARYVREHGIAYPVVSDPRGELAKSLDVGIFPTTLFVSGDGTIVAREVGYATEWGLRARWWLLSLGLGG